MRTTRRIRNFAGAALICGAGLAATAPLAVANTRPKATRPVAHAALTQLCLWENVSANPKLWIRQYPSTDAAVVASVPLYGRFYGSDRGHFNEGVFWVQLDTGGWANATYLQWKSGGSMTESYCMD
jgi:hypothetical protein